MHDGTPEMLSVFAEVEVACASAVITAEVLNGRQCVGKMSSYHALLLLFCEAVNEFFYLRFL